MGQMLEEKLRRNVPANFPVHHVLRQTSAVVAVAVVAVAVVAVAVVAVAAVVVDLTKKNAEGRAAAENEKGAASLRTAKAAAAGGAENMRTMTWIFSPAPS